VPFDRVLPGGAIELQEILGPKLDPDGAEVLLHARVMGADKKTF
jgi:hypothetical protein